MSKEELSEFLEAIKQVREANTATPEAARLFLQKEGYLDQDGRVSEHYPVTRAAQTADRD